MERDMKVGRRTAGCLALIFVALFFAPVSEASPAFTSQEPVYFFDGPNAAASGPMAIASDTLAVAGLNDGGSPTVYVYAWIDGLWVESARLSTPDVQLSGYSRIAFGASLAISPDGQTIFVGDPGALCPGSTGLPCGVVDVYQEPAGGWSSMAAPTARLRPSVDASEELGGALAIDSSGSTLVAYGDAVYVYAKPASGWANATQTAVLGTASGTGSGTGFVAVSVDAGVVAVNGGVQSILVYGEPAGGWQDTAMATATLTYAGHFDSLLGDFGSELRVAGGSIILVGAPTLNLALVYQEPGGGWVDASSPTAVLQQPSGQSFFPSGLNIVGSTAVVSDEGGLLFYDEPVAGWSSEAPTSSIVPGFSANGPIASAFGGIYASGTELIVSSDGPCTTGTTQVCAVGYALSSASASSDFSGIGIYSVSVGDQTTAFPSVSSANAGDEFNFDFDVMDVTAPAAGNATLEASVSGGTLIEAHLVDGASCKVSGNTASCPIGIGAGKDGVVEVTMQSVYDASTASVKASLTDVSPQSWDALAATMTASVTLIPVPLVPANVTFSGYPGETLTGKLPVQYAGKNPLSFTVAVPTDTGKLTVDPRNGSFTWVPPPAKVPNQRFTGSTEFTYYVSDGVNRSQDVDVTLTEQQTGSGGGGGFFGVLQLVVLLGSLIFARRRALRLA